MQDHNPVIRASNEPINPFAAPEAEISAPAMVGPDVAAAEVIRKEHISSEKNLQTIGFLMLIGGFFTALFGVIFLVSALQIEREPEDKAAAIGMSLFYLLWGGFSIQVARGLRRFKNRSRVWACVLMLPGIISPVTWLFLYCLMNKKGKFVCTPEYARIIEQTPHVQYKTSVVVKIFGLLLLGVIMLGIAAAIFSSMNR